MVASIGIVRYHFDSVYDDVTCLPESENFGVSTGKYVPVSPTLDVAHRLNIHVFQVKELARRGSDPDQETIYLGFVVGIR